MENDLSKLSLEERRKILRERLRNKIKSTSSNRLGKHHSSSKMNEATKQLSQMDTEGVDMNQILQKMIPDSKQRKINRKRLKKLLKKKNSKKAINNKEEKVNNDKV